MGNRAIIKGAGTNIGVYVHWNGGYDSVLAFTQYCKLKGYRSPESDPAYGTARLAQVIGNYFGGGLSVGIENMSGTTVMTPELVREFYLDNGVYEIKDWKIVKHWNPDVIKPEDECHEGYDLTEMLCAIDECQPKQEQLGTEFITADLVDPKTLYLYDEVFIQDFTEKVEKHTVIGFAPANTMMNGHDVSSLPFVDKWGAPDYENNINNYLTDKLVRKAKKGDKLEQNRMLLQHC